MGIVACFTALTPEALQHLQDNPDEIEDYLYPDGGDSEPPHYIDLDKAWHGIHYLLTGSADDVTPPLGLAIVGGEEFGDDVGYGPARFLIPGEVAQVATALAALTDEELTRRFKPEDMEAQTIYPDIWVREGAEALDYLLDNFRTLQTAYADAAARGDAVILWMA